VEKSIVIVGEITQKNVTQSLPLTEGKNRSLTDKIVTDFVNKSVTISRAEHEIEALR